MTPNEYAKTIVLYLDQNRESKGITYKEIAEGTGIAVTQVKKFFLSNGSMGFVNFIKIVRYLGLTLEFSEDGTVKKIEEKEEPVEETRTDEKVVELKSMYGEDIQDFDNSLQFAYETFANAVIRLAVDDYRELKKQKLHSARMGGRCVSLSEIENFFTSDWFSRFTALDGKYLLRRLKKEK